MKPIVTWILLANARYANMVENRGPGKGLQPIDGSEWHADEAMEHRDKAGFGHNISGPGMAAVEATNLQLQADIKFAKDISNRLTKSFANKKFNRLIIVSSPHMLGLLRANLDEHLHQVLVGEIDKDLVAKPISALERHLEELLAI